jgi:hypothetical protein
MDDCDIYVADLAASAWEDVTVGGAAKAGWVCPLSPAFPPIDSPTAMLENLVGKIESGQVQGGKVDQDYWVAAMTPDEIIGYIDEVYNLSWYQGIGSFEHLSQQMNVLLETLIRLDPRKRYALVARKPQARTDIAALSIGA